MFGYTTMAFSAGAVTYSGCKEINFFFPEFLLPDESAISTAEIITHGSNS